MSKNDTRALSDVLSQFENILHGESISVSKVIEHFGYRSFATLMLLFSLISTSPASAIPGITAIVATLVFILIVQMIIGRDQLWLPVFLTKRKMSTTLLLNGIHWIRRPIQFIERFLKPRFTFLLHRPWLDFSLILILCLTIFMPFMEIIPTSGSLASAIIAIFAAGLLTRDGGLVLVSLLTLLTITWVIWSLIFS